jgi:hypothetical protein
MTPNAAANDLDYDVESVHGTTVNLLEDVNALRNRVTTLERGLRSILFFLRHRDEPYMVTNELEHLNRIASECGFLPLR